MLTSNSKATMRKYQMIPRPILSLIKRTIGDEEIEIIQPIVEDNISTGKQP